jgi:hypothetical protein
MCPTVQAYRGPINDIRGVEFSTNIAEHPNGTPLDARWYLDLTPGVELRTKDGEEYAAISASVVNYQF